MWWVTGDRRLSRAARATISAGGIFVSVVSLWEIEIKRGVGALDADTNELLDEVARTDGFAFLEVGPSHISTLVDLPPIHRDPFDRMLVAQAARERVPLVTRDRALRRYPIDVVW